MKVDELCEVEAIKRLKYRYMRCLDLKRWDELRECFCEDATSAYAGGKYSYRGRDAIIGFFREVMTHAMITAHHVHHPEIELTSETTAVGSWALEDTVIHTEQDFTLRGAAYYRDEYVKIDGDWKIVHTGYERIYEEIQPRTDVPGLTLVENMWAKG